MVKTTKSSTKAAVAKKATKAKKSTPKKSTGGASASTRILQALASLKGIGKDKADRSVVRLLAAMSNERSFNTTILNMKNEGLVLYDKDTIWFTEEGCKRPEAASKPLSNTIMHEKMKDSIDGKRSREIFDVLVDGNAYTRAELAEKVNLPDNKSFGTYLSKLSEVTERVEDKKIRLIDLAFPCGRPCEN